ncbi:hypothetical protein OAS39_09050 [Pirellulales bacterium]|nr:hypothetical protein [Pirellulales bacterium]
MIQLTHLHRDDGVLILALYMAACFLLSFIYDEHLFWLCMAPLSLLGLASDSFIQTLFRALLHQPDFWKWVGELFVLVTGVILRGAFLYIGCRLFAYTFGAPWKRYDSVLDFLESISEFSRTTVQFFWQWACIVGRASFSGMTNLALWTWDSGEALFDISKQVAESISDITYRTTPAVMTCCQNVTHWTKHTAKTFVDTTSRVVTSVQQQRAIARDNPATEEHLQLSRQENPKMLLPENASAHVLRCMLHDVGQCIPEEDEVLSYSELERRFRKLSVILTQLRIGPSKLRSLYPETEEFLPILDDFALKTHSGWEACHRQYHPTLHRISAAIWGKLHDFGERHSLNNYGKHSPEKIDNTLVR